MSAGSKENHEWSYSQTFDLLEPNREVAVFSFKYLLSTDPWNSNGELDFGILQINDAKLVALTFLKNCEIVKVTEKR